MANANESESMARSLVLARQEIECQSRIIADYHDRVGKMEATDIEQRQRIAELERQLAERGTFAEGVEAAAKLVENGSFLHDKSPAKLFANEVVPRIRALARPEPPAMRPRHCDKCSGGGFTGQCYCVCHNTPAESAQPTEQLPNHAAECNFGRGRGICTCEPRSLREISDIAEGLVAADGTPAEAAQPIASQLFHDKTNAWDELVKAEAAEGMYTLDEPSPAPASASDGRFCKHCAAGLAPHQHTSDGTWGHEFSDGSRAWCDECKQPPVPIVLREYWTKAGCSNHSERYDLECVECGRMPRIHHIVERATAPPAASVGDALLRKLYKEARIRYLLFPHLPRCHSLSKGGYDYWPQCDCGELQYGVLLDEVQVALGEKE